MKSETDHYADALRYTAMAQRNRKSKVSPQFAFWLGLTLGIVVCLIGSALVYWLCD